MNKIKAKIDPTNPYIIVIISLVILVIIMLIFVPSPKSGVIFKTILYFGIALAIILDLFRKKVQEKYTNDSYTSSILKTVNSTIGSGEGSFINMLDNI